MEWIHGGWLRGVKLEEEGHGVDTWRLLVGSEIGRGGVSKPKDEKRWRTFKELDVDSRFKCCRRVRLSREETLDVSMRRPRANSQ